MPADRFPLMLMTMLGVAPVCVRGNEHAPAASTTAPAPEAADETGRLRIEGRFVTHLLLTRAGGSWEQVSIDREGMARLPAGSYVLRTVQLQDPNSAAGWWGWMPQERRVVVTQGGLTTLRVGGPLRQKLSAQRNGRAIVLSHELIGIGGERYRSNSGRGPTFTVYDGNRRIGSGQFEYG